MTDSPFLSFAERRDLDYAERTAADAGTSPFPHGEVSDLVGGELPGGLEGIVARLRRPGEGSGDPVDLTLVVTRIPESGDFARFISCFEAGFRGAISRIIGAGGLGWIREYSFESIEFNRRYRVAMLRTGKESRLRQLFAPTFLDWMAETAPEGLYFDLVSEVLTVTLAGAPGETAEIEAACELAGHIAERIRSEALEGSALESGKDPEAQAALAAGEARYTTLIERAGVSSPEDVASTLERLGPAVKAEKGLLGRMFGSRRSPEATMLALSAVLRAYGDRNGMKHEYPDGLVELLPFFDHFPMAVMRLLWLRGELPGARRKGDLVALLDLERLGSGEMPGRPAFEAEAGTDAGFLHILPREGREGGRPSAFGGFRVALGDGDRRETDATRKQRERAEELSEQLGDRYDVVAHRRPGKALVGKDTRAWLADEEGRALVLEGGTQTLVGEAGPVADWSFESLDRFCKSVAPALG